MKLVLLFSLVVLAPALVSVEGGSASALARGNPRQFDFWVGSWECRTPSGQLAGTNRIEKILNDRVLQEHWQGSGGGGGKSFNIYDALTDRWHQTWVDGSGTLLLLDGGMTEAGSMVLKGGLPTPDGGEALHRIAWTPLAEGKVHQVWDTSADGGGTWTVLADLVYSPAPEAGAEPGAK